VELAEEKIPDLSSSINRTIFDTPPDAETVLRVKLKESLSLTERRCPGSGNARAVRRNKYCTLVGG
jgi:hypothetical protein